MRTWILVSAVALLGLGLGRSASAAPAPSVAQRLAAARAAGRTVFLFVSEPGTARADELRAQAQEAQGRAPGVELVEMDRKDPANRAVVHKYGLVSTPLPMVLILASNGAPAGGAVPGSGVVERLLSLLPSPRKADTLLALFEGKAAFVVVGRPKMPGRAAALKAAHEAVQALEGKGAVVEVDLGDKVEQGFLDVLGADRKAKDTAVHVYALSGRKTAVFHGPPAVPELLKAARKKASCCPGGKCG
jgi:hypothetical protein